MRKLQRKLLNALPESLRFELIRKSITLPKNIPGNLKFKIAENPQELESAFRLVYESYLPLGYCAQNEHQLRGTIFHAMPSTTTLLAIDSGKVVGTLTLVRDGCLGLPMGSAFDLSSIKSCHRRSAEITAFVIHPEYRRKNGGQVLFPLLKLMYEYATTCFGVDDLLIAISPKDIDFYRALLLFEQIPGNSQKSYYGSPAVALHLDLTTAKPKFKKVYSHRCQASNLFDFFVHQEISTLTLPSREFNTINDPIVFFEYYQEMFVKRLALNQSLSFAESRRVQQNLKTLEKSNIHKRFETNAPAQFVEIGATILNTKIMDASKTGFRSTFISGMAVNNECKVKIEIAKNRYSTFHAKTIWSDSKLGMGWEITRADLAWGEFMDSLSIKTSSRVA